MKNALIPTVIQDYKTLSVLMLGYSTDESLKKTKETGFVHFWSRKRKKLWMKGEQSGNKLRVWKMFVDCDQDTILIQAELAGKNVCHTGKNTCFYTKL